MRHRGFGRRAAAGFAAIAAAIGLVALGPLPSAQAAGGVDQITGNGMTDSAVTVGWAGGLLGADNHTVVKPRDPASPYAFMYADFEKLAVTVGQTENLVHQSIKVTWTGGKPTRGTAFGANYLQLMQCYGDASSGPDPQNCQYGSAGLLPNGSGTYIGGRTGLVCASNSPSTTSPPGSVGGTHASLGCDPGEPATADHLDPAHGGNDSYTVPFIPVNSTDKLYGDTQTSGFFNRFNSNEVQQASTRPDGTGEVSFNALTGTEASGLGCGALLPTGQPRACWLVIVPRGEYEPNGWKLGDDPDIKPGMINESPLGAASWAHRIQVHLGFSPIQPNCPIGSAKERQTVGTQTVSRAVYSWQLALNTAAKCTTLYGFSPTPEASSTSQLASPAGAGLAFTTVPIGSEVTRGGGTPPALPLVVYAPVAVSAITLGFNINLSRGAVTTPVKLTPRLLAKALTQSYRSDLTDFTNQSPGPAWAKNNPTFITDDPEFTKLNPEVGKRPGGSPIAPLLTADHSGVNQQVWAWIQGDASARAWLAGTPDEHGMVVNPHYRQLTLDKAPAADSFPRADPTCHNTGVPGERKPGRCSLDLLPYVENFDDGASRVRAANNPQGADWDPGAIAPDGSTGWWVGPGIQLAGKTLMWAVADSGSLANYGLIPADLCRADGSGCVSANTTSVTAALRTAKADSKGLLHVDPAAAGSGGYPLVSVTYAAVRTTQTPDALGDYASFITFAVNQGQIPGVNPGQLPHGYLPLSDNLREAAKRAVAALLARATPAPSSTATRTGGGGDGGATSGPGAAGVPQRGAGPAAGVSVSTPPYSTSPASAVPAASTTAPQSPGAVRWVLLCVLTVGLAGVVGGPLLRVVLSRRTS